MNGEPEFWEHMRGGKRRLTALPEESNRRVFTCAVNECQAFPAWLRATHGGGVSRIALGGAQQWLDGRSRFYESDTGS